MCVCEEVRGSDMCVCVSEGCVYVDRRKRREEKERIQH